MGCGAPLADGSPAPAVVAVGEGQVASGARDGQVLLWDTFRAYSPLLGAPLPVTRERVLPLTLLHFHLL